MRARNKPVLIFFCLLLSAAAVLAGVNIYSELKERQKEKDDFAAVAGIAELPMTEAPTESVTDAETETSAEPTEQPAAEHDIQALIAENADCIGWLSIDGTNISYPVMYTPSDPQKYLRRSFYGKYSQSGVPFLDGRCDLQSTNLITVRFPGLSFPIWCGYCEAPVPGSTMWGRGFFLPPAVCGYSSDHDRSGHIRKSAAQSGRFPRQ